MLKESEEHNEHSELKHTLNQPMRIVTLTDGVFAIIMTLLILEVKIPEIKSGGALKDEINSTGYRLFLFAMSFLLAGVYWISHRVIFSYVRRVNTMLVWLNIIFLMICSLIPFGAAILGNYPHDSIALFFYGILLTLLAGWRLLLYLYVTSHHDLLYAPVPAKRKKRVSGVMIFAPVMFFLSLCLVPYYPTLSLILFAVTPVFFATAISIVSNMPVK